MNISFFVSDQMGEAVYTSTSHHKQASVKAMNTVLSQRCFDEKVSCLYGRKKTYAEHVFRLSLLLHQIHNCWYPDKASFATP